MLTINANASEVKSEVVELVNNAAKENAQIENSKKLSEKLANRKKSSVKVETQKNVVTTKNGKVESKNVSKQVESKSFNDILAQLNVSGLKTNSGLKKENLYKNSVYSECLTDKDKKSVRRKIRSLLDNFIGSIIRTENKKDLCKQNVAQFIIFYEGFYRTNDYTLSSLVGNITDEIKKENLQRMLTIVIKNK